MILLICILFLCLVFYGLYSKRKKVLIGETTRKENNNFLLITLLGLILRCVLAVLFYGFSSDIYCFKMWADELYKYGLNNYYDLGFSSHDYVPGYLYILYIIGFIKNVLGLGYLDTNFLLLIKLPAIIFDLLTSFLVFKIAKEYFNNKASLIFYVFALFNLAFITNSSLWGQVDSIHTFFMVLTLYFMKKDKLFLTGFSFVISLLFKFQSVFIMPVVLFYLVKKTIKTRKYLKNLTIFLSMFIIFYIISLPFSINHILDGELLFPFKIYFFQLGNYNYYTLNAFNLYGLLGLNFVQVSLNKAVNYLVIIIVFLFSIYLCQKAKNEGDFFLISAFLVLSIFTFSFKMHERYLYPFLIMLLISGILNKDKGLIKYYIYFSLLHFLNTFLLLINSDFTFKYGSSGILGVFSFIHMFLYFMFFIKIKNVVIQGKNDSIYLRKFINKKGEEFEDNSRIFVLQEIKRN